MSVIVFVKFDDTCATSLRMLMGFDGNVKGFCSVQQSERDAHCELDSRPFASVGPGGLKKLTGIRFLLFARSIGSR